MEAATLPDYLDHSADRTFYQETADRITSQYGPIEWTPAGPVSNGINVSMMFMYPPLRFTHGS